MAGWFDFLTETPEFIKKKAQSAYDYIEPNSVFDPTIEKIGKNLTRAAIRQGEDASTPLNVAAGSGMLGFGLGVGKRLGKIPLKEHYLDAIRLGKTHDEAIKIAASGGRRAADKAKFAQELEKSFGGYKKSPTAPYRQVAINKQTAIKPRSNANFATERRDLEMLEEFRQREIAANRGYSKGRWE